MQINYINNNNVDISDIAVSRLFYFSGFLFYVDGWSWDNVPATSNIKNISVDEVFGMDFKDAYNTINKINQFKAPNIGKSFNTLDSYNFPELYIMAATCRRYQIYNRWREKYNDVISPSFLESYSENIPSKTPIQEGNLTWTLWSGDIQSFTNIPGGRLQIGSYVFARDIQSQKYTPVSIENSSRNIIIGSGYGENTDRYITNYYNPVDAYTEELFALKDGWYGSVSLDSTPYTIEPGYGIDFDTFFKLKSNKIVEFHSAYTENNISPYGLIKKQFIDN